MKQFILSLFILLTTNLLFATEPSASYSLTPKGKVQSVQIEKHGFLFINRLKKDTEFRFVSNDLSGSFTIKSSREDQPIGTFSNDDFFYITHWEAEKKGRSLHIIKADASGVVKKTKLMFDEQAYQVIFNDEDLVVLNRGKENYYATFISGENLNKIGNKDLKFNGGSWGYLGFSNGMMRFCRFISPNNENGFQNSALEIAMLNRNGEVVKEHIIDIPGLKNKRLLPIYYYTIGTGDSRSVRSGGAYGIQQSPYSSDIVLYTYYMVDKRAMVWNREGLYLIKLRVDEDKQEIVYQKNIKFLNGTENTSYYVPLVRIMEDDHLAVFIKEKTGGALSGKFLTNTAILNPEGEMVVHEVSDEVIRNFSPSAEDVSLFLKTSKKINSNTPYTALSTKLAKTGEKDIFDLARVDDKWVVIRYNEKTGKIDFYRA